MQWWSEERESCSCYLVYTIHLAANCGANTHARPKPPSPPPYPISIPSSPPPPCSFYSSPTTTVDQVDHERAQLMKLSPTSTNIPPTRPSPAQTSHQLPSISASPVSYSGKFHPQQVQTPKLLILPFQLPISPLSPILVSLIYGARTALRHIYADPPMAMKSARWRDTLKRHASDAKATYPPISLDLIPSRSRFDLLICLVPGLPGPKSALRALNGSTLAE